MMIHRRLVFNFEKRNDSTILKRVKVNVTKFIVNDRYCGIGQDFSYSNVAVVGIYSWKITFNRRLCGSMNTVT